MSSTNAYGGEFKYAYDTVGHMLSASDPAGATAHYEYDAGHRLQLARLPDGRCVVYKYDKTTDRVVEERIGRCAQ